MCSALCSPRSATPGPCRAGPRTHLPDGAAGSGQVCLRDPPTHWILRQGTSAKAGTTYRATTVQPVQQCSARSCSMQSTVQYLGEAKSARCCSSSGKLGLWLPAEQSPRRRPTACSAPKGAVTSRRAHPEQPARSIKATAERTGRHTSTGAGFITEPDNATGHTVFSGSVASLKSTSDNRRGGRKPDLHPALTDALAAGRRSPPASRFGRKGATRRSWTQARRERSRAGCQAPRAGPPVRRASQARIWPRSSCQQAK